MNLMQEQNDRFAQKLKETMYPNPLPARWVSSAYITLHKNSLLSLGVSADDYSALVGALDERKLSMMQFAVLSNALEAATPKQLGFTVAEYAAFMHEVKDASVKWNETTEQLKADVQKEIQMLMAASGENERPGLSIVKAEA